MHVVNPEAWRISSPQDHQNHRLYEMPSQIASGTEIEIAIVGGGIIGLILGVGLDRRGTKVKVYEQAGHHREIGAGIALTANAIRCMRVIDPGLVDAFKASGAVGISSGDTQDPRDYLRWVDGYNQRNPDDPGFEEMLCEISAGYGGLTGVRRDQFLESLSGLLPPNAIEFRKRLITVEEKGLNEKMVLHFEDGTSSLADAGACGSISHLLRGTATETPELLSSHWL